MNDPRFSLGELGDAFGTELEDALATGRWLQASIDDAALDLPAAATGFDAATEARGGFGDRVMAALADEPAPAPAGFLLPLRRLGLLRGLWASFRQASVATRGGGRPIVARAAALAYVLAIVVAGLSLTGAAAVGAGAALGLFQPSATESAPPTAPVPTLPPTPAPSEPAITPSLPPEASPSPSPSPSETPDESDDHGGGGAEASDDHGGNSGPGGGDDRSGGDDASGGGDNSGPGSSGSGSDDETPRPTGTPKPSQTPH